MSNNLYLLTIHRADNYGTALQAYASQVFLSQLGYDVKIIDYRCSEIEKDFGLRGLLCLDSIPKYLKRNFRNAILNKSHRRFLSFYKDEYNLISLDEVSDSCDSIFAVGSDQVWNYKITGKDTTYLLKQFNKGEKVSFASSFGMQKELIANDYLKSCQRELSKFRYLSVREKSSISIVEELTGNKCEVIIDPTLLLNHSEWETIANEPKEQKYILLYQIGHSTVLVDIAKQIQKELGLNIITIKGSMNPKKRFDATYIWDAGPKDFLGLFKNAEYVITNSFHGTAFSINFHKKFFCQKLATTASGDSRISDLLSLLNLTDREIYDNKIQIPIDSPIDYESIELKLSNEREKAKKFVKSWKVYEKSL